MTQTYGVCTLSGRLAQCQREESVLRPDNVSHMLRIRQWQLHPGALCTITMLEQASQGDYIAG